MRRVRKGFSGRDTSLFPTMMVRTQQEQDEAVNEEMDDSLERVATTATGIEAEQDSGNIDKTQSKATLNEPSSLGTSLGSGPSRQDTIGDIIAQTRVLDLENTKIAQAQETTSLKLRVKKLEKKGGSRTYKLKRLYKVGRSVRVISSDEVSLGDQDDASKQGMKIDNIDKDAEITLVHETQGRYGDEDMFNTCVLDGDEVLAEPEVTVKDEKSNVVEEPSESITTTPTLTTTTTAATTITAVSTRPKAKGLVIHEDSEVDPQLYQQFLSQSQSFTFKAHDKGKEIMVEEPVKMKKKDQISLDEELSFKLQAKEEEEEILPRRKSSKREKEPHQRTREVEYKRKVQVVCTTLRSKKEALSTGYKYNQLKNKSFDDIQKLFDKAMKRVNTFVDIDTKLVEGSKVRAEGSETRTKGSSKGVGEDPQQESIKKQKVDEDNEIAELQRLIEVVFDKEEVAINAIPLETKPPSIVNYKIHKEGKKTYY
ncbi:hypothetical protein Tco_0442347 [Tanacetum coccineum]